jgi:16S rRNA (guanine966-N2)-methyltransferase
MRIVGGTHRGRSFYPPKNLPVRPTTDFGKEALFNILANRIDFEALVALDLFSGTGSIGYELVSRGCASVTAVDEDYSCCAYIKKMADEFGFPGIRVIKSEVFRFLKNEKRNFDLIFADPPYEFQKTAEIPQLILGSELLKPGGLLIIEHPKELGFEKGDFFLERRTYSKVNFSLFKK